MRAPLPLLLLSLLATACGSEPPTQAEVDEARGRVERALASVERGSSALQLLGLLPDYTCGEDRRSFLGRAAEGLRAEAACLSAEALAASDTSDLLTLRFAEGGCEVRGHRLEGELLFHFSEGADRLELGADFTRLRVDGTPMSAQAGYGTCGDETRYWARAQGEVPDAPDYDYGVDLRVAQRDGIPLIGGTQLVLDGESFVLGPQGRDSVALSALDYEVGHLLPREGSLEVLTADGHRVRATFRTTLWRLGEAELTLDDHEPVTVPVLH